MTTPDHDDTFPVAEGARRLGQTETWYLRQLRERKLPGIKVGRKWRLTEATYQAALDICATTPTPAPNDPLTPRSRAHHNRTQRTA